MIRYSCDLCKCEIDSKLDLRYVVRIEVAAAMSPLELDEAEDDRDHLLEMHEILERLDDADSDDIADDIYQNMRFDLCAKCRQKFVKSPLGRDMLPQLNFSKN